MSSPFPIRVAEAYRRANPVSVLDVDARRGCAQSIVGSGRKRGAPARHASSVKKSLDSGCCSKARVSGMRGLVRKGNALPRKTAKVLTCERLGLVFPEPQSLNRRAMTLRINSYFLLSNL